MAAIHFVGDYLPTRAMPTLRNLSLSGQLVGNLECAIGGESVTSKAYSVALTDSAFAQVGNAGFAALSIANNHALDAGPRVFDRMVGILQDDIGVRVYGTRARPHAELRVDGRTCAVVGCLERCRSRGSQLFPEERVSSLVRELRSTFDRVYVTPHWGKESEYASHPSPEQRRRAREWIDVGVDGVFGHHSHTAHGWELLDGKPVFYSLGNAGFDHEQGRPIPLTSIGVCVSVQCEDATGTFDVRLLVNREGGQDSLCDLRCSPLESYFETISADLWQTPWTSWRWARAVGPVYIPKSLRSWRKRLGNNLRHTLPRFVVWMLVPKTLLLSAGWLIEDSSFRLVRKGGNNIARFLLQTRRCDTVYVLDTHPPA